MVKLMKGFYTNLDLQSKSIPGNVFVWLCVSPFYSYGVSSIESLEKDENFNLNI